MRLLILEDDFDNQLFINVLFKSMFEIDAVDNYDSAKIKIEHNDYDLFLIDISLRGDMNGLDFVRYIRKMDKYKEVPIACLTAYNYPKDRKLSKEAGVDLFLAKPIHPNSLKDSVMALLEQRGAIPAV